MNGTEKSTSEGRVEIRENGTEFSWGTICDDNFDDRDATVICRMLNYRWGEQIKTTSPGLKSQPVYLDEIECTGDEESLSMCHAEKWKSHNCGHIEDVTVRCHRNAG